MQTAHSKHLLERTMSTNLLKPHPHLSPSHFPKHICPPTSQIRTSVTSPKRWWARQSSDPFVKQAAVENYRSRAAFKLEHIQKRHKILRKGVVVLGPGRIISIDLLPIDPIPGAHILQGDMRDPHIINQVVSVVSGEASSGEPSSQPPTPVVDVLLSDMAHSFTGNRTADVARVHDLCRTALDVASLPQILKEGGVLVCKFLQGDGDQGRKSLRRRSLGE
ncbi:hypothetical protein HDV00_012166 [Rhizophlyctis rosea]|nr:hypothetical protein HDV00_012166 [Rhizophlyctis rosea]